LTGSQSDQENAKRENAKRKNAKARKECKNEKKRRSHSAKFKTLDENAKTQKNTEETQVEKRKNAQTQKTQNAKKRGNDKKCKNAKRTFGTIWSRQILRFQGWNSQNFLRYS